MAAQESIKTNIPEFSVSELAFSLKKTLEENYAHVRVRGEVGRVTIPKSGHVYLDLKDADSVLNAICWKGTLGKLSVKPEEGLEVVCTGRITTYPSRSNYQLIIDSMELAGEGALLKMLEERRKKLASEGLFDRERKKPLPFLPEVIGVITSPTGAVIRDILHRLEDRFPRHVIVWPVAVQGAGAAEQVAAAIEGFNVFNPRPDLLIVARGGGSLEDLMAFNEEIVVRAAANSKIPLISAIGHETDVTLIDYAADLRAPTPTGAAEMAVPVRAHLMAQVLEDHQRLINGMTRMLSEARHKLDARAGALADPRRLLETKAQALDHAGDRLERVFNAYISAKNTSLLGAASKLRHPRERIESARKDLLRWSERLHPAAIKFTGDLGKRLDLAGKMLEAYSFENVLARGFVVVQDDKGAAVTEANALKTGQSVHLRFKNKKIVDAIIGKKDQGKLF